MSSDSIFGVNPAGILASSLPLQSPSVPPQGFDPASALHVYITREPGLDWFNFKLPNGYTEELDPDQARKWLKDRGANMVVAEKALDRAWSFYSAHLWITKPKMVPLTDPSIQPDIGDGRLDPSTVVPHAESVPDTLSPPIV
jgi:hypothetical protein